MTTKADRIYIFVEDAQVSDVLHGDITEVEHKIIIDLDFAHAGRCPLCDKELPEPLQYKYILSGEEITKEVFDKLDPSIATRFCKVEPIDRGQCCLNCGYEDGMTPEQMINAYEARFYE